MPDRADTGAERGSSPEATPEPGRDTAPEPREARPGAWGALVDLVEQTIAAVGRDDVPRLAAAMAYFLLITLAPLVLVLSVVGGLIAETEVAQVTGVNEQLPGAFSGVPEQSALDIVGTAVSWAGPWASLLALGLVVFGAMAVFAQFVGAMNRIWRLPARRNALWELARHNLLSFLLLVVFAVVTFASLLLTTLLAQVVSIVTPVLAEVFGTPPPPGAISQLQTTIAGLLASFGLFSIAFWIVPRRAMRLRDVVPGAALTAIAYQVGAYFAGRAVEASGRYDIYGTFSIFVAGIVFIYYVAMIVLIGAEFTRQWVLRSEWKRGVGPAWPETIALDADCEERLAQAAAGETEDAADTVLKEL